MGVVSYKTDALYARHSALETLIARARGSPKPRNEKKEAMNRADHRLVDVVRGGVEARNESKCASIFFSSGSSGFLWPLDSTPIDSLC